MPGFTRGIGGASALFGSGALGDFTASVNFQPNYYVVNNSPSVIRTLEFANLVVPAGVIFLTAGKCPALLIKVRGTLVLNGSISADHRCTDLSNGANLHFGYADIYVPATGAQGGASNVSGLSGVDGQCGGGGGGGSGRFDGSGSPGGAGGAGWVGGGGAGGGGSTYGVTDGGYQQADGGAASQYGKHGGAGARTMNSYNPGDDLWQISKATGGGGAGVYPGAGGQGDHEIPSGGAGGGGGGGVLIVMANRIEGNGSFTAVGAPGGAAHHRGYAGGGGGGGGGGGSITLFYGTMGFTGSFNASGGAGGAGSNGRAGGAGGNGSIRAYSLAELASHPRL